MHSTRPTFVTNSNACADTCWCGGTADCRVGGGGGGGVVMVNVCCRCGGDGGASDVIGDNVAGGNALGVDGATVVVMNVTNKSITFNMIGMMLLMKVWMCR